MFGYGSLEASFFETHCIDIHEFAAQNGWIVEPGLQVHCFSKSLTPKVEFGGNYTRKQLKEIAKGQKARTK